MAGDKAKPVAPDTTTPWSIEARLRCVEAATEAAARMTSMPKAADIVAFARELETYVLGMPSQD